MVSVKAGYPAENGSYLARLIEGDNLRFVSQIFRVKFYAELFPKYDIWSKTLLSYEGSINKPGDVVLTGDVKRRPLAANYMEKNVIPLTDSLEQFDRGVWEDALQAQAVIMAKKIRYAHLGTWSRFVCGINLHCIENECTMNSAIVIQCVYGFEFK
jgi:hypothetical protein